MPWLEHSRYMYVLGRGGSLGSVHEGSLLFHESARTPAVAMTVPQFRHGPVEVVSPDFRAIVFATQNETRVLDAQLATELEALGGQTRLITTPEIPITGPFAAILEIIPVQVAAVRLTEARGIPPAQFQFSPLVTDTETGFKTLESKA
jgi:glutamine---fructose-6-phosphate transaminase (isomerizing)